jgi:hypothetical protein
MTQDPRGPRKTARLTGEIFNHRLLWHSAHVLSKQATDREEGSTYSLLAATLFAYLALEAYLNDVGPRVAPEQWKDERESFSQGEYRGTLGKLEFLLRQLDLKYDKGRRPFQTVRELDRRRDALVHPRTEKVDHLIRYRDAAKVQTHKDPELFEFADQNFLVQAFQDIEVLCDGIQGAARQRLGEHEILWPVAFRGAMWHQGGSLEA